jgi:hypothetical protein
VRKEKVETWPPNAPPLREKEIGQMVVEWGVGKL